MSRPLPILFGSEPTPGDWAAIKQALTELNISDVRPVPAVPGSPGRILVMMGDRPGWACDYAHLTSRSMPALKAALEWVLTDKVDSRAVSMANWLADTLGVDRAEVREVETEMQEPKVVFK